MKNYELRDKMEVKIRPNFDEYICAVSCMDYTKLKTGVPKVMLEHQEMFLRNNTSYVGIVPVKKMLFHERIMLFCMFGLIVDGKFIGVFQMNQIIQLFFEWNELGIRMINIHLHHLMYINLNTLGKLIDSFSNVPIKIYIHDYYLVCSSFNLLFNGKYYCGGKGLNSEACQNCNSFTRSKKNEKKISSFLHEREKRITFISPSEITKEIFCRFYPKYNDKTLIIPHQVFCGNYKGNLNLLKKNEIINVAFLGSANYKKGWETWEKIINNAPENAYKFFVFNSSKESYNNMEKIVISFTKNNLNAMTDALRVHGIHIVLLWSLCPETYSYTCNEAFSANAFIITNTLSGNIHDSVVKNKNGIILESEEELIHLFKERDSLRELVNEYRKKTVGGPETLNENEEIVSIVNQEKAFGPVQYKSCQNMISQITNIPLLWFLNKIY